MGHRIVFVQDQPDPEIVATDVSQKLDIVQPADIHVRHKTVEPNK